MPAAVSARLSKRLHAGQLPTAVDRRIVRRDMAAALALSGAAAGVGTQVFRADLHYAALLSCTLSEFHIKP